MHRAIVEQCLPGFITLAVLSGLLWGVARFSGARFRVGRLAELHSCQAGGVQSLAFVLTLPLFLMILLFIVQVALLMIGLVTVNYAAFAAARSAAVWIPAQTDPQFPNQNYLPEGLRPSTPFRVDASTAALDEKYTEVFDAAVLACVTMAPSRDVGAANSALVGSGNTEGSAVTMYGLLVPSSSSNPQISRRLRNKIAYARANTVLHISYTDKNSGHPDGVHGPTHNPFDHPTIGWRPSEVGWQDPVEIEVEHRFALLPGPGRFLAKMLVRWDGRPDQAARRVFYENGVHKVRLVGSATLTIEGIKSVRPYVQLN